ncbi:DNA-binding transcriptional regulator LsrR (DeoR family) [Kineosphaera limosa]|uniref:Putative transcriptional regulator n=1 Tax=Kineosphaera limosa NBRC 100340 TaxID=1184609 RepID=K6WVW8_9MICO|nr:sugar-binding domain-containing protein [Kineosphaera limosa]NYD99070.1 DNA-binding transcriptional regulator LsrR (DeoR family) [Kineosphaera limosa]GAB97971.1 putative transcriptional regulator [Kineosphaera limosa NBRC 100340]
MNVRDEARRAATLYYLHDETMATIAATLGVSRSTVSRLLKHARETGLVRITVDTTVDAARQSAERITTRFGVRTHIVEVRDSAPEHVRLDQVARVAARLLADWVEPGMIVGVAWGTTVSAIADHLPRRPMTGVQVLQLNGSARSRPAGVRYAQELLSAVAEAFDADIAYFPTPAFFDYVESREALWRESAVRELLELRKRTQLAVFGVGATAGTLASEVYRAGYLAPDDIRELHRERVVGDVCTVFLRRDGTYADVAINARASGPTPRDLARIPRRLCVVVGEHKVPALLGALSAGVATDLVLDQRTASALLRSQDPR